VQQFPPGRSKQLRVGRRDENSPARSCQRRKGDGGRFTICPPSPFLPSVICWSYSRPRIRTFEPLSSYNFSSFLQSRQNSFP
jgi:hypothetical protein